MDKEKIKEIEKLLKEDVRIKISNKEYVPSVDSEMKGLKHRDIEWLNNAWKFVIVSKNDSYHWDSWGALDLDELIDKMLEYLKLAKGSRKKCFKHIKTFLR